MRAIRFEGAGQADVIKLLEEPLPQLRPHDLLVRVHAAGLNRADILQRQGFYGDRPDFGDSLIPGLETAGEVVEVGCEVTEFQPADRVMAIVGGAILPVLQGALADRIGIHHAFIIPAVCYLYILYYALRGSRPTEFAQ